MSSNLTIRFKPEKTDYIAASRTLASRTPVFLILAAITALFMLGALIVLLAPGVGDIAWKRVAILSLLVGGFYFLYYFFLIPWQLSRSYKNNPVLQLERKFSFDRDELSMQIGDKGTKLARENIEKVIAGKDLYLMVYKGEQRAYPFIPKRVFNAELTEEAFRDWLKEHQIPIR